MSALCVIDSDTHTSTQTSIHTHKYIHPVMQRSLYIQTNVIRYHFCAQLPLIDSAVSEVVGMAAVDVDDDGDMDVCLFDQGAEGGSSSMEILKVRCLQLHAQSSVESGAAVSQHHTKYRTKHHICNQHTPHTHVNRAKATPSAVILL